MNHFNSDLNCSYISDQNLLSTHVGDNLIRRLEDVTIKHFDNAGNLITTTEVTVNFPQDIPSLRSEYTWFLRHCIAYQGWQYSVIESDFDETNLILNTLEQI